MLCLFRILVGIRIVVFSVHVVKYGLHVVVFGIHYISIIFVGIIFVGILPSVYASKAGIHIVHVVKVWPTGR